MESELTPLAKKLLDTVRDAGGNPVTRSNVAQALNRKRLAPYDIDLLNELTERGLIETVKVQRGAVLWLWAYKLPDTDTTSAG